MRNEQAQKLAVASSQFTKYGDYWLENLSGEFVISKFTGDFKVNEPGGYKADYITVEFPGPLLSTLEKVRNGSDPRLHMILTAGVVLLLDKYFGNRDIIIGMPIYRQEIQGDFINTILPLRNRLKTGMTFKYLLLHVREVVMKAVENQNYPVEILLDQLNLVHHGTEDFPLFDIAVLVENIHDRSYLRDAAVNVIFSFSRTGTIISGKIEYNALRYKKQTMEKTASHFVELLSNALQDLNLPLSHIAILSQAEKEQILYGFNETEMKLPVNRTVTQLFDEIVAKNRDHIACVYEDEYIGFGELDGRSDFLALELRERGVTVDKVAALLMERSLEIITCILAVWKAGGAYLPIDLQSPAKRVEKILRDSKAVLLIALERSTGKFVIFPTDPESKELHPYICFFQGRHEGNTGLPLPVYQLVDGSGYLEKQVQIKYVNHADDLAYVLYTSGSTGVPKGVMVEHGNVVNLFTGLYNGIYYRYGSAHLNVALLAPFSFDPSLQQVVASLLLGNSLCIVPENSRVDGEKIMKFYLKYCIDISDGTPTHLRLMLEILAGTGKKSLPVEHFIIGGEFLPPEYAAGFFNHLKDIPLITNAYGPAECCVDATLFTITPENISSLQRIPIGAPMANVRIYILDRNRALLPMLAPGEIYIGGAGVARGYLDREILNREKFTIDPFIKSGRLYRTGDLGRWLTDGNIEFMGRIDQQVKIRGVRIELGEIRSHLTGHPGISDALVIAKEDKAGDKFLAAYIVPRLSPAADAAPSLNATGLREYLAQELPDYLIPQYFVTLEKFPLNANGKVAYKSLPEPGAGDWEKSFTPPGGEIEENLARIWCDVLMLKKENISVTADFFSLGGHSLKATIMLAKLHKEFHVKVPLAEIFKNPTIREMAGYIRLAGKERYFSIKNAEKREYYPVSSGQRRLYFYQQLDPGSILYNIPLMIPLKTKHGARSLEHTFNEIIRRHESLRTCFADISGEPVQKIEAFVNFRINYIESRGQQEPETMINSLIEPFDLRKAPLLCAWLIKSKNGGDILIVNIHHIITDGLSMGIFEKDFSTLYSGEQNPPLRFQYKDFSLWQAGLYRSEAFKSQAEFWLNEFKDDVPVLNLPLDFPRPAVRDFAGGLVSFWAGADLDEKMKRFCQRTNTTLFMVLLAVYNILLAKYTGQEDIVIGIPLAGRRHADLEHIIGMFVNMLALRNYPRSRLSFMEFLEEVKEKSLQAFANQDYPLEMLVDKLNYKRDTGRSALFDASFWMQNIAAPSGEISREGTGETLEDKGDYTGKLSRFDISLICGERENNLIFYIEYSARLFKKETIVRMGKHFINILKNVLGNEKQQLAAVDMMSRQEKEQVLSEAGRTADEDEYDFV